jgi:hypothetical protein
MEVVILKSKRYHDFKFNLKPFWQNLEEQLENRKHIIHRKPREADVSIVLSGLYENPVLVKGKRVLAFKAQEWIAGVAPPHGWRLYEPVLKEYYDDFIDLAGLDSKKSAKRIIEYIDETKKSRSQD